MPYTAIWIYFKILLQKKKIYAMLISLLADIQSAKVQKTTKSC